jgi:YaaC-like Protein
MEQAEQLFTGAASADYVIKPILIFYGFSQACRAMAASSSALDYRTFRPRSHGLEVTAQPAELADQKLAPRPEASTSMLATLQTMLGFPPWSEPLTLGQLWSANPDLAEVPLPNCADPEALRIGINQIDSDPAIPRSRDPSPGSYKPAK